MDNDSNLTARTAAAVGWTTAARLIQHALQFGLSIFLMRVLGPSVFGLVAMVLVFSGFATIFKDMGFGSALIQRQTTTEAHRSSTFWFALLSGAIIFLIIAALSPLVAAFYSEPLLQPVTACIALSFLLSAPSVVPRALLQKSMRFDHLAIVDVTAVVVAGIVAVVFAVAGAGVWSLVVQHLVADCVSAALSFRMVAWRPKLILQRAALHDLVRYGAGLTGFNIINYWARSADNLLIGRFLGATSLGLYSRAYSLMLLPQNQIIGAVGPAMFSALASLQHDKSRVRGAYLRAMRLITFMAFPLMFGLIVVAEPFVMGLLGSPWRPVIGLIQILGVVGITQTLCKPVGWIYTSQGRTDWMLWWGVGGASALVVSIVIGILIGSVESVAYAYMVGNLLVTIPCIAIPGRLIKLSVIDVFNAVRGNLGCAAAMAAALWLLRHSLPSDLPSLVALGILVPLGVLTYICLVYICRLQALTIILEIMRTFWPSLFRTSDKVEASAPLVQKS